MQWQIIDADLIASNISDDVEILWVVWTYNTTVIDQWIYLLWWPACARQLWWSWETSTPRWALRFYDDWTKIIIMGSSEIQAIAWWSWSNWAAWYYAEIEKSTWILTTYPAKYLDAWTTTTRWNTKMVYTNMWWTNRYWFTRASADTSVVFFYFDWTQVQSWYATQILAASNIWSSSISYRWRTLQSWTLFHSYYYEWYWSWASSLQTMQYS